AALAGRGTSRLLRQQAVLEESIRRHTHRAPGRAAAAGLRGLHAVVEPGALALAALEETLAGRALLEIVELDGQLLAVVLADGTATLHRLGARAAVANELDGLRFSLRRLALDAGSPASLAAASDAATYAAKRLDSLLIEPAAARVRDRPLVIVPTGILHGIPWSVLPSLVGRTTTVAPSAAFFCRTRAPERRPGQGTVLVAGPGLSNAEEEIDSLASRYPGATRLVGDAATVGTVTAALDGAALAHVAAHGTFRADNPLFSSLKLADGPLTVYDLEALERTPPTLVLSACESGLSGVCSGDELMGLASALFALGTATLVASVVPVPDAAARELMVSFHRNIQAGLSPAAALARAQADGDGCISTGCAGFVCFGDG
ncbi:MAG: CHAT domain-containing protein, partial [Acidimicrobiales bacterium]